MQCSAKSLFPIKFCRTCCFYYDSFTNITPVAGPIFETKNRAIFSGELFSGEEFREKQTFSRPLFQKEAFEIWGCSFVSKKRTRFGSNNDQFSIHFTRLLDYLKSSENYCPRKLFSGSNSSPEKRSPENIARFLPQKSVPLPA